MKLLAGSGADYIPADLLQKPELLRGCVERDEVHLHRSLALAKDLARDILGIAAVGVIAVGDDKEILPKDARAVEIRPGFTQCVTDRRPTARSYG